MNRGGGIQFYICLVNKVKRKVGVLPQLSPIAKVCGASRTVDSHIQIPVSNVLINKFNVIKIFPYG